MKKKDILNKLKELGTLIEVRPQYNPDKKPRRPKKFNEELDQYPDDDAIFIYKEGKNLGFIDDKKNATLGFKFELNPITKLCECGQVVVDRKVEFRYGSSPQPHWKEKCLSCMKYRNPNNKKFDLLSRHAQNTFVAYFNALKNNKDK